jgi:cytochrome c553
MARLLVFVGFLGALIYVLGLGSLKKLEPNNARFDINLAEKKHQDKVAQIQAAMNPVIIVNKEGEVKIQIVEVALNSPELLSGHEVFQKCISCHGKAGQGSKGQKAPRIAAQHAWYIEDQILKMKSGERVNKKMFPSIKKLTEQEISNVALYLSKLPAQPNRNIKIKYIK